MLIPKGQSSGMKYDLFVMISNYEEDRVDQSLEGICNQASGYCGIRDRKFPDSKPMGFPFDRRGTVNSLSQFVTPNMKFTEVSVVFNDRITQRN